MSEYIFHQKPKKKKAALPRRVWWLVLSLLILAVLGVFISRQVYNQGLKPVNNDPKTRIFTVQQGSSVKEIGADLQKTHLIRSAWAFQLYVHSKELNDKLQAGTYALSPS